MTIKTKIVLANTLVFGLILFFFGSFVYRSYRDAEISKLDSKLAGHAESFQSEIEEQINQKQFPQLKDFEELSTVGLFNIKFQIVDETGKVIVANEKTSLMDQLTSEDLKGSQRFFFYNVGRQRYRLLASPIVIHERNKYILELAVPMESTDISLDRLLILFMICFPAALFTTSFLSYWIVRISFRPLTDIIKTSQKISVSNLETKLSVPKGKDEVHLLGDTLNRMIDRIRTAFTSQRQFIADASHEIRTPLTIIYNELEFAKGNANNQVVTESIQNSLNEIERLTALTDGMLTLSRLDALYTPVETRIVRLDEIMVECVQILKSQAVKKLVDLQVHVDDAVEMIGDKDKIKSLIFNLLENAIKYTNRSGSVMISLLINTEKLGFVMIRVENTGAGISVEDLPHVFNRFFRSSSVRQEQPGNGLGLAIVDQIVKLHGGKVIVSSERDINTVFIVELPLGKELSRQWL